jgi:hypothetical protein
MGEGVTIHLQQWNAGLGSWVIDRVREIFTPNNVIEYYATSPSLQQANEHVKAEKPKGHLSNWDSFGIKASELMATAPWIAYQQDLEIWVNEK